MSDDVMRLLFLGGYLAVFAVGGLILAGYARRQHRDHERKNGSAPRPSQHPPAA